MTRSITQARVSALISLPLADIAQRADHIDPDVFDLLRIALTGANGEREIATPREREMAASRINEAITLWTSR